jgi:NAD(P)H-flavin reductase
MAHFASGFDCVRHNLLLTDARVGLANNLDCGRELLRDGRAIQVLIQVAPESDFLLRWQLAQGLFELVKR